MLVAEEEVPPEWSPSIDQLKQEPLHIKEEQDELCTGQEGLQLKVLEKADTTSVPFTAVTVKSENEEGSRFSQCHQRQTEDKEVEPPASSSTTQIKLKTDEEDCGGSKTAGILGVCSHLQPNTDGKASNSSETKDGYYDWQEPLSDCGPETEDNDG